MNLNETRGNKRTVLIVCAVIAAVLVIAAAGVILWNMFRNREKAEDTVKEYFAYLSEGKYDQMYALLDSESRSTYSEEDFISRNQNIYEGIGASDIRVDVPENEDSRREDTEVVTYSTSMDTSAGEIDFDNQMTLKKNGEGEYRIDWDSTLIFPSLLEEYRVSVDTVQAQRGTIYDRLGNPLATQGTVSQVGLVPGKMNEDSAADIQKIAELLDISADTISSSLEASYVQDDTFVPLKQISKNDTETEEQLLAIPGILIQDALSVKFFLFFCCFFIIIHFIQYIFNRIFYTVAVHTHCNISIFLKIRHALFIKIPQ